MYKIKLPNFEGPFDLLLYFIKRDELNIYDIPISKITSEFLNYIRIMQYFDLELAGEFLLMASTLMYIKTQMLLPRNESEDEEIEDPRTQLVQRLIEYKQFKEAAGELKSLEEEQRYAEYRKFFDADLSEDVNGTFYKNASLFDLMKAFKTALERAEEKKPVDHVVNLFSVTIDEQKDLILKKLKSDKRISFFELMEEMPRPHIIVTFLAMLELIKWHIIAITQSEVFDDILIVSKPKFNLN